MNNKCLIRRLCKLLFEYPAERSSPQALSAKRWIAPSGQAPTPFRRSQNIHFETLKLLHRRSNSASAAVARFRGHIFSHASVDFILFQRDCAHQRTIYCATYSVSRPDFSFSRRSAGLKHAVHVRGQRRYVDITDKRRSSTSATDAQLARNCVLRHTLLVLMLLLLLPAERRGLGKMRQGFCRLDLRPA